MRSERFDAEIDIRNHAVQRGYERELTVQEIIAAIDHPEARCQIGISTPLQTNRRFRIESGSLVVIVEKDFSGFHVVTVFYRNRRDSYDKNSSP